MLYFVHNFYVGFLKQCYAYLVELYYYFENISKMSFVTQNITYNY